MKRDSATKSPTSSQKNEAKKSKVTNLKGGTQSNNEVEETIHFNSVDVSAILAKDDKFDIPTMKRDAASIKNSIFEEGFLCPRRFQQMEEFEHAKYKRSYIHKYYDMYFEHTYKLHTEIDKVFIRGKGQQGSNFDTKIVEEYIKQLKDIAERVGALKVLNEIDKMLKSCKEEDLEGFISAFDNGWEETIELRKKVDPYFELMCRIGFRELLAKVGQRTEEHGVELEWKKILNSSLIESSSSSEEGSNEIGDISKNKSKE